MDNNTFTVTLSDKWMYRPQTLTEKSTEKETGEARAKAWLGQYSLEDRYYSYNIFGYFGYPGDKVGHLSYLHFGHSSRNRKRWGDNRTKDNEGYFLAAEYSIRKGYNLQN